MKFALGKRTISEHTSALVVLIFSSLLLAAGMVRYFDVLAMFGKLTVVGLVLAGTAPILLVYADGKGWFRPPIVPLLNERSLRWTTSMIAVIQTVTLLYVPGISFLALSFPEIRWVQYLHNSVIVYVVLATLYLVIMFIFIMRYLRWRILLHEHGESAAKDIFCGNKSG